MRQGYDRGDFYRCETAKALRFSGSEFQFGVEALDNAVSQSTFGAKPDGTTLTGYDDFAVEFQVPAVSGPWGNGELPSGNYNGGNLRKRKDNNAMMCPNGSGWSLDLDPTFPTDRTLLRIHPDGNVPGTEGCIGASCTDQQTVYDSLKDYFSEPGYTSIPVIVQ